MNSKVKIALLLAFIAASASFVRGAVTTVRVPQAGIQPQVAVDRDQTVHLVYYKGDAARGDLFYARQKAGDSEFSPPMTVNSRPGSAVAAGSIRGGQLAIGKNNRVHIVWNGSQAATPAKIATGETTPLVYTRLNDAGTAFEPERNLITYAGGLDGGSSIAADPSGNVYATWHASIPGGPEGEAGRAVFIARSTDEGKSFRPEIQATKEPTGACGCCGMRAFADDAGAVYILYRGAEEKVNRDEILLISPKPGAPFKIANRHPWNINTCPMSSAFFASGPAGVLAAWETTGQVFFTRITDGKPGAILSPTGPTKRKHPVAVANAKGETLLAWTEGTAWAKGGSVAWQIFDAKGNPNLEQGRAENLPVWSLVAAYAKPDGDFVVIY